MESPQRDPRPPTLPTTIQSGPDATHAETDYHLLILRKDTFQISLIIVLDAPSYNLQISPIHAGPDTEHGCASGKALSGRTWHHIRTDYEPHSRTVLPPHRYGPYHVIYAILRPSEWKVKKIAKCHILYTPYYPILPYLYASFTSTLTLHIDTNWKSAIYASSKHNVHNVTHKSVKQKVSKSNKVSHRDYRTDLLVTAHLHMYGLLSHAGWLSWRDMMPCVIPRLLSMAHFTTIRRARFAHHEVRFRNVFRAPHDCPRSRKNVTHVVTILCVQGAPRYPPLLPIHARFSILTRPYVPILWTFILVSLNFAEYYSKNA